MRTITPYAWIDDEGVLHLHLAKALVFHGLKDTPRSREIVGKELIDIIKAQPSDTQVRIHEH